MIEPGTRLFAVIKGTTGWVCGVTETVLGTPRVDSACVNVTGTVLGTPRVDSACVSGLPDLTWCLSFAVVLNGMQYLASRR